MADVFANSGENESSIVIPTPTLNGIFIRGIDDPYSRDGFLETIPFGGGATTRKYIDSSDSAEVSSQSTLLRDLANALVPAQGTGASYNIEGLVGPQGPPGKDGTTLILHEYVGLNSSYLTELPDNVGQIEELGTAADKLVYTESYTTYYVQHWRERRPAGDVNRLWRAAAIDDDGTNLIAAIYSTGTNGALYTSSDSGDNWTLRDPAGGGPLYYQGVASDSDGSHLVVCGAYKVYTSSNSGVSWTERDPAGGAKNWTSADTDSDGSFAILGCYDGVYKSSDSGVNWDDVTPNATSGKVWGARCDSTGTYLIAWYDNRVYTSANGGSSWTQRDVTGEVDEEYNYYTSCDVSGDGSVMIACSAGDGSPVNGRVFISSDYGVNWTEKQPNGDLDYAWIKVCLSSDGTHCLSAIYNGRLYISENTGTSWAEVEPAGDTNRNWGEVALDSDGNTAIVVANSNTNGRVYTFYETSYSEATWAESDITSAARSLLDDADTATQQTTLGLGTGDSPEFTGLTLSGLTESSIPFISSGGVLSEDNTNLTWNDSTKVLSLLGTLDASAGKVLVTNCGTIAPTIESDGYIGVATIDGEARVYFRTEGIMWYINTDGTDASPVPGNPVGLLLTLTYA